MRRDKFRELKRDLHLLEAIGIGLGAIIGAGIFVVTGVAAGVVGFLLSFVGLAGIQGLMSGAGQYLTADAMDSMQGVSTLSASLFNLLGVVMEIGFGALGGLIGGALFRTDRQAVTMAVQ